MPGVAITNELPLVMFLVTSKVRWICTGLQATGASGSNSTVPATLMDS